jgi:hypothetical protein
MEREMETDTMEYMLERDKRIINHIRKPIK